MMIIPSLKGLYTVKQQNFESRYSNFFNYAQIVNYRLLFCPLQVFHPLFVPSAHWYRIMDVSYDASLRDAIVGRITNGVGFFLHGL